MARFLELPLSSPERFRPEGGEGWRKAGIETNAVDRRSFRMAHELELKFEIPHPALLSLGKSSWFRRLSKDIPKSQKLDSVYYDTKDHALRDRDISLRVRKIGKRHLQTVKARASKALDRHEWEETISGGKPQRSIARHTALEPFADKKHWRRLKPIFETKISRTTACVRRAESRIELALDHGYITAKRRRLPVSEIELELKEGSPADLLSLAREIQAKTPVGLGLASKAWRGYALAEGRLADHRKSACVPLHPDLSTEEGFRAIAMACLTQAAANKGAILENDPEGVHQMRVGVRRLRTALALFKAMIDGPETDAIKTELKWLSAQLAPARDFDVLESNSVKPMKARDPDGAGLKALEKDVAARRKNAFAQAQSMVRSDRYRDIILKAGLWTLGGRWTRNEDEMRAALRKRPLADSAADILSARTGKVVKKIAKFDDMDDRRRHKLRIAVKKLRYATDFFDTVFPGHHKRRKDFGKSLKRLQSALGRLNDIRVHAAFAGNILRKSKNSKKSRTHVIKRAFGLGQLTGREKADANYCLADAGKAGKAFSALKPYWP